MFLAFASDCLSTRFPMGHKLCKKRRLQSASAREGSSASVRVTRAKRPPRVCAFGLWRANARYRRRMRSFVCGRRSTIARLRGARFLNGARERSLLNFARFSHLRRRYSPLLRCRRHDRRRRRRRRRRRSSKQQAAAAAAAAAVDRPRSSSRALFLLSCSLLKLVRAHRQDGWRLGCGECGRRVRATSCGERASARKR